MQARRFQQDLARSEAGFLDFGEVRVQDFKEVRIQAEFLKGVTVRLHGRAKIFRDCARFGFANANMHN